MKRLYPQIASAALAIPVILMATDAVSDGTFDVNSKILSGSGLTWNPAEGLLSVGDGAHTVTGNGSVATDCRILVSADATLTIHNVHIDRSSLSWVETFEIGAGASVTLELMGTNTFKGAKNRAGIGVLPDASLAVVGPGSLVVKGGTGAEANSTAAGIHVPTNATLTVGGGTVTATGGAFGAGIGGGYYGSVGSVAITGGMVVATGGNYSAGIGGGNGGSGGAVTLTGGSVTAYGNWHGAGIGGGRLGNGGIVTVTGGTVTATGGSYGAGIGGGIYGNGGTVIVMGGSVTANGGYQGAGIGGGRGYENTNGLGNGGSVIVTGGAVNAVGGGWGAGIGGGHLGGGGTVTITGGAVTAAGGNYGSGFGMDIGSGDGYSVPRKSGGVLTLNGVGALLSLTAHGTDAELHLQSGRVDGGAAGDIAGIYPVTPQSIAFKTTTVSQAGVILTYHAASGVTRIWGNATLEAAGWADITDQCILTVTNAVIPLAATANGHPVHFFRRTVED